MFYVLLFEFFFCFKQKTAYEMRISDWSSDVCDSADYVRQKYSRPLSTEWIDTALRNASRRHKAGVPMHAYLSALSAAHTRLIEVIRASNPSVADACRLGDVIQRLAMVEAAVMAEHYGLREEERARKARHAQSAEYRETLGGTLEATAVLGSRARLQGRSEGHTTDL